MKVYHFASKKKPRPGLWAGILRWVLGLLGTVWLSWIIFFPGTSGALGSAIAEGLKTFLGTGVALIPFLLLYILYNVLASEESPGTITLSIGAALLLTSLNLLLEQFTLWTGAFPAGAGLLGKTLSSWMAVAIGGSGVFCVGLALGFFSAHVLFNISWTALFKRLYRLMEEDFRSWQKARRDLKRIQGLTPPPPAGETAKPPAKMEPPPARETARPDAKPASAQASAPETRAKSEVTKILSNVPSNFKLPPTELLESPHSQSRPGEEEISQSISRLERTLADFQIDAKVTGYSPGPVITRYEVTPAPGVKISTIVNLSGDIALAMKAPGIRAVPIPGKSALGIEVPNLKPSLVGLREILESPAFQGDPRPLTFAIGRTSEGEPIAADLASMPHILVAGATNSGKSVCLHSMIVSLLFRSGPDQVKLLLVDPKRLELTFYEGIPHLYDPKTPCEEVKVVTQPKEAAKSLKALVKVMENRYDKFSALGVRNIEAYNQIAPEKGFAREFYIVVVIDELADLMLVAQEMVEDSIQRLAQMARAVGIHLVLSTQRPSVDVITGVIKANLTSRIALQVISKTDSRVILDVQGAEQLLGKGDMLYLATGAQRPARIQCAYISEKETKRVVDFLKGQGKAQYPSPAELFESTEEDGGPGGTDPNELAAALKLVLERRRVSQDLLKAHFGSSARATNLLSLLEVRGFIHKPEGTNRWDIFYDKIEEHLNALNKNGK